MNNDFVIPVILYSRLLNKHNTRVFMMGTYGVKIGMKISPIREKILNALST